MIIRDELVDSISIKPSQGTESLRFVKINGAKELLVLTSSLGFFNFTEINYIVSGVWERQGIAINGTGFRYPTDELNPGEEPLQGVEVYNPLGEIQVSINAFERLIVRYFETLIAAAYKLNDSITQQSWWPEFMTITEKVEERLKMMGMSTELIIQIRTDEDVSSILR